MYQKNPGVHAPFESTGVHRSDGRNFWAIVLLGTTLPTTAEKSSSRALNASSRRRWDPLYRRRQSGWTIMWQISAVSGGNGASSTESVAMAITCPFVRITALEALESSQPCRVSHGKSFEVRSEIRGRSEDWDIHSLIPSTSSGLGTSILNLANLTSC